MHMSPFRYHAILHLGKFALVKTLLVRPLEGKTLVMELQCKINHLKVNCF